MSSQYWKNVRQGREHASSLVEAVQEELDGGRDHRNYEICWVYKNSYSNNLRKWIDIYGKRSTKVIIFKEWVKDTEKYIKNIFSFIGVEGEVELGSLEKKKTVLGRRVSPCCID